MRNDDMCFFCKKAFPSFFGKTWFQNSCKGSGCIFPKDKTLFESSKFLNEYSSICIVVDFQNPSKVEFPKKIEDHSWHEAKARKLSRKDELDSILKDNFTFKEELELKCSVENCPGDKAYRGERIKVFPNILLVFISFNHSYISIASDIRMEIKLNWKIWSPILIISTLWELNTYCMVL